MAKRDCKSEPRTTEIAQPTHRCEFHSSAMHHGLFLRGEWLEQAGFLQGMPIEIRVMPDCIVITTQDTRELWGCIEGLSVVPINRRKVAQWLKEFPGAIHNTCDVPKFKRNSGYHARELK